MSPTNQQPIVNLQPTFNNTDQLMEFHEIIRQYVNLYNQLTVLFPGINMNYLQMDAVPNVMQRIINIGFQITPQYPTIDQFMTDFNLSIGVISDATRSQMRAVCMNSLHINPDIYTHCTILQLYARAYVVSNLNDWYTHIMYESPYNILDNDDDDLPIYMSELTLAQN
jgi:hypothetical protein